MDQERHDFYSNSVNVTTGLYDVILSFSTQSPVAGKSGEQPILEASAICNVRMSPQHAKSLTALLLKHITDYERNFEVILPVPPDIREIWDQKIAE